MKPAALAGIFCFSALAASAAAQSNTWIQLSPAPSTHWVPTSLYDCTQSQVTANPQGRAFSGSDYGNGKIFYWGGGHNAYPGNDMEVYDIATNQWTGDSVMPQCWAPCCAAAYSCGAGSLPGDQMCDNYPIDCSGSLDPYSSSCLYGSCINYSGKSSKPVFWCSGGSRNGQTCTVDSDCPGGTCPIRIPTPGTTCPTCKPYTEHTYQKHAYNPNTGHDFFVIDSGTWDWNPTTRSWTWLAVPAPQSADFSDRIVMYDPVHTRMLYIQAGGGNRGVYWFNDSTHVWTGSDSYLPVSAWTGLFGTWDARAQRFVIAFGPDVSPWAWYLYDPTQTGAAAWTSLAGVTPSDLTAATCGGGSTRPCFTMSLVYDATNQRTVALTLDASNNFVLWALDAVAQTWTRIMTSGGSSTAGYSSNQTGGYNTFHYDPGTASLYLLDGGVTWQCGNSAQVKMWKIQLALGTPAPTASTATRTTTQPAATPTITGTPTNTRPSATPTNTQPTATPTITPTITQTPTTGITTPTPTCAGTVRLVGPARTYTKPSQAAAVVQANDCVYIDAGNYPNDVALWPASASNVTIRGAGGMVNLTITNGIVYGSKGIWVVDGANTTIENISFSCATSRTNNTNCSGILVGDENDAGIRLEAAGLTVRNCVFHDNDNGILGGPSVSGLSGDTLIESSEFFRNGFGDGYSHNVYLNAHHNSVTFRYNYSHGAIVGHLIKSRAATNYVLYNRMMDEAAQTDDCTDPGRCSASAEVELPCGGLSYVIGNVLQKSSTADAAQVVRYAAEVGDAANCPLANPQELYVVNNTMVSDYGPNTQYIKGAGTAPLLWAKNNVFFGAGNAVNWPAGGTQVTAGNVIADPKFVSQTTYDYHLTANSSAAINQGVDPGTDPHGYNLVPMQQYVYDRTFITRPSDGSLDVGAFEYIAGATPFPTPTNSPPNTPTPSPIPSATPTAPIYCSAGQLEAVYPVAASADDGIVEYAGSSYSALSPYFVGTGGYANSYNFAIRKNAGSSPYVTQLALWRWNTAALPDGSAWPAGSTVTTAFLRPYWNGAGSGSRPVIFEWHNWPPPTPLSYADWTNISVTSVDATFAGTTAVPTASGRQTIPLSNVATNVNLAGDTGLRMTISGDTPPVAGEDDEAAVFPRDYQTSAGDLSTQLVICYVPGLAKPAPPQLL